MDGKNIKMIFFATAACVFSSTAIADISSLRNKTLVCEDTSMDAKFRKGFIQRFYVTKDRVLRYGIGSVTGGEIFNLGGSNSGVSNSNSNVTYTNSANISDDGMTLQESILMVHSDMMEIHDATLRYTFLYQFEPHGNEWIAKLHQTQAADGYQLAVPERDLVYLCRVVNGRAVK